MTRILQTRISYTNCTWYIVCICSTRSTYRNTAYVTSFTSTKPEIERSSCKQSTQTLDPFPTLFELCTSTTAQPCTAVIKGKRIAVHFPLRRTVYATVQKLVKNANKLMNRADREDLLKRFAATPEHNPSAGTLSTRYYNSIRTSRRNR